MAGYLGLDRDTDPHRAHRHPPRGPRPVAAPAAGALHPRLPRAHRAGEGPAPAGRGLPDPAPGAGPAPLAAARRRLPRARARGLPARDRGAAALLGPAATSSATRAKWTARRRSPSCGSSTCCPCRARTRSPRASTCSRPWPTACPGCEPRHGAFAEMHERRRAAASCSSPTTRATSRRRSWRWLNDPAPRGGARAGGAAGVRRTTPRRAWPSGRSRSTRGAIRAERPRAAAPGLRGAALLVVRGLRKDYTTPRGPLSVLDGISFTLAPGQSLCVMGPSGSGKSTLLYILGALEPPTSGTVTLAGRDPFALPEAELAAFRNREVGFVFQDHCLLPQCSVLENVLVPTLVAPKGDHEARARELLDRVGLARPARPPARPSSRAARSSAWPSRARSSSRRASSSATSPPATSTRDSADGGGRPAPRAARRASRRSWCSSPTASSWPRRFPDRRRLADGRWSPPDARGDAGPRASATTGARNAAVVLGVATAVAVLGRLAAGGRLRAGQPARPRPGAPGPGVGARSTSPAASSARRWPATWRRSRLQAATRPRARSSPCRDRCRSPTAAGARASAGLRRGRPLLRRCTACGRRPLEGRGALLSPALADELRPPTGAPLLVVVESRAPTSPAARCSAAATIRARASASRARGVLRGRRPGRVHAPAQPQDGARGLRAAGLAAAGPGPARPRQHRCSSRRAGASRRRLGQPALARQRRARSTTSALRLRRCRTGARWSLESASGLLDDATVGHRARASPRSAGLEARPASSSTSPTPSAPAGARSRTRWWRRVDTPRCAVPGLRPRRTRPAPAHRPQRLGGARAPGEAGRHASPSTTTSGGRRAAWRSATADFTAGGRSCRWPGEPPTATWCPPYPGITETLHMADWDPPFPVDLERIRPQDEEYWAAPPHHAQGLRPARRRPEALGAPPRAGSRRCALVPRKDGARQARDARCASACSARSRCGLRASPSTPVRRQRPGRGPRHHRLRRVLRVLQLLPGGVRAAAGRPLLPPRRRAAADGGGAPARRRLHAPRACAASSWARAWSSPRPGRARRRWARSPTRA